MKPQVKIVSSGTSPAFVLFLVFLVLKLTGVIAWSWWWVTSPIWIPLVLAGGFLLLGFLFFIIAIISEGLKE